MDLPLENITINSRPVIQATERWVAYSLMTFNLSLILTLTLERCLAIQFPFWTMAILTSSHATYTLLSLVGGTLTLHTPQFVREVVLAINEPTSLKDGFQGKMTQRLSTYRAKTRRNQQPGNIARVDVSIVCEREGVIKTLYKNLSWKFVL
ncbi:hypothetical protein RRG08_049673 [Elysia crispata]|uniref:Uncharacterized protein n=1 Tax=Elysia crispata TaxID=231223 RepID=A0AAE1CT43_9GAST|nr:hypothetical protein RRG08_049673 [Elysia crispata]